MNCVRSARTMSARTMSARTRFKTVIGVPQQQDSVRQEKVRSKCLGKLFKDI